MKRVVVTGANGHVGNNLCRHLVDRGYQVRAAVRDATDRAKLEPLSGLDVEVVSADIMRPETLAPLMKGIDGVFQLAAVYASFSPDPQRDIIDPSVVGGLNVLRAASDAGVRRVVFTSSCAAVGNDAPASQPLTEADWTAGSDVPYSVAKTRAEQRAWDFARDSGLDLVAINPSGILGPGFYRHTPTTQAFEWLVRGLLPVAPPVAFSFVDVRDVAQAHRLAYEVDAASGRYIIADRCWRMLDLMRQMARVRPGVRPPLFELPAWLVGPVVVADWLGHQVAGLPRQLTLATAREFVGKQQHVSSDKARRELGWRPMPFDQCLGDTVDWIRKRFIDR